MLGIGVNVNGRGGAAGRGAAAGDVAARRARRPVDRVELLAEMLDRLERAYDAGWRGQLGPTRWRPPPALPAASVGLRVSGVTGPRVRGTVKHARAAPADAMHRAAVDDPRHVAASLTRKFSFARETSTARRDRVDRDPAALLHRRERVGRRDTRGRPVRQRAPSSVPAEVLRAGRRAGRRRRVGDGRRSSRFSTRTCTVAGLREPERIDSESLRRRRSARAPAERARGRRASGRRTTGERALHLRPVRALRSSWSE